MGKLSKQQQLLPVVVQQQRRQGVCSRIFCCSSIGGGFSRIIAREFNFKCLLVLLLTLALSVYALFSVLPILHQSNKQSTGFEAKGSIILAATAQAYFRLQKPASDLIHHISELENEILGEIGIPSAKVAILSMHQLGTSNWTDVVFGVLPDPLNVSIEPHYLTLLRIVLVDLFFQESNLTLKTTFGQPFSFDILKFPGGITLIPEKAHHFGEIPEILFNFTLNNSIDEVIENFVALNRQLRSGLLLMPEENVYIQLTSKIGSTRDPPVVVEASITSDFGNLTPQRLRQLAEIIRGSSGKNLGLDNSVFGKVKEVILSSCLNHSVHALPPSLSPAPSPSPSPELIWDSGPSLSPDPISPTGPRPPAHFRNLAPCSQCDASTPSGASQAFLPSPDPDTHPPSIPNLVFPPDVLPSIPSSSSSLLQGSFYKIWWICLLELLTLHLLCSAFIVV